MTQAAPSGQDTAQDSSWPRLIAPMNIATGRTPKDVLNDIVQALLDGFPNELFLRNDQLVYVPPATSRALDDIEPNKTRRVTIDLLSALISECAVIRTPGKPPKDQPVPERTVREILAMAPQFWEHRVLHDFVDAPYLSADREIVVDPGYNEQTGYFSRYRGQLHEVDKNDLLTTLRRMFMWYPFANDDEGSAGLAHAIGMHITPLVRPAIKGPTPAFLISAHKPGMGKTELSYQPVVLACGRPPAVSQFKGDKDVYSLDSLLARNPPYLVFDNAASDSTIGHPALDMALTSGMAVARIAGAGTQTLRIRSLFIFTGNRVRCTPDMARRTVEMRFSAEGAVLAKQVWDEAQAKGEPKALTWVEHNRD